MIRGMLDSWSAKRLVKRSYAGPFRKSIAVGFAWGRDGVGGLRNHIEAIKQYSRLPVKLFPETKLSRWAIQHQESRGPLIRPILDAIPLTQFGVVHSHVDPPFIHACHAASNSGVPWIHTYHTLYFPEDWGGSLLPWQNEINECLINVASKADVRLSISPWLQTLLRDKHGIETQVLPNGYNPTLCNTAGLIEQAWDKRVSSPYILYVGSLFDVKNPRLFIELATRLPREQFVMIGKDLVADIVSERFEMELPRNLLLAGPQSHTATLRFIRNSQSLIVTSHSEGLPTVVMEAMALGKLVIAPNSFGCGDLLRHEENGLTYAPSDLDSLVHLVSRSSSPLLGAQAAKDAEQHYAWPSIAQRLDALYQSLLNV